MSLPALQQKEYDGARLRLGAEVYSTATQRQYEVTYRGSGLTISGRIAIPEGEGPFPAIVLAHGYIDPAVYVNGQGMTREREWFADHGYIALHVDYRNHAGSDDTAHREADLRMGYTEDVINAVLALRDWNGPVDDDRMAVGGRSMGGGVVYNVLVAQPGLVDAGVVWAPVSSDPVDNYNRWIATDPGRAASSPRSTGCYGLAAGQPGVLGRHQRPHLLRPDHRAGADPPRHRRRHLPAAVEPRDRAPHGARRRRRDPRRVSRRGPRLRPPVLRLDGAHRPVPAPPRPLRSRQDSYARPPTFTRGASGPPRIRVSGWSYGASVQSPVAASHVVTRSSRRPGKVAVSRPAPVEGGALEGDGEPGRHVVDLEVARGSAEPSLLVDELGEPAVGREVEVPGAVDGQTGRCRQVDDRPACPDLGGHPPAGDLPARRGRTRSTVPCRPVDGVDVVVAVLDVDRVAVERDREPGIGGRADRHPRRLGVGVDVVDHDLELAVDGLAVDDVGLVGSLACTVSSVTSPSRLTAPSGVTSENRWDRRRRCRFCFRGGRERRPTSSTGTRGRVVNRRPVPRPKVDTSLP